MTAGRLIAILIAVNAALLAVGLVVAKPDHLACEGPRVGLVFDVGGKNDKSFNEAAWRGVQQAKHELKICVQTIEPSEGADRESALRALAAAGVDLVIGVGFIFSPDLERLATKFPNVMFAGVDYAPSQGVGELANLVGLQFREHEGSFLVGAIAGLSTTTQNVGFVGGMRIPLIRKFEAGYIAGVKHVCPGCQVQSAYAGSEPKAFADPSLGQDLASAQYARGADIIYHAAGKTGDGVFAAARQRKLRAIGVDSDQFHVAPCCVMTSMVKRVDRAVVEVAHELVDGSLKGGMRELGLADDGVGFVNDANNATMLPADVVAKVNALRADIIAGRIVVPAQ